jgi:hypothetical protein
MLKSTIRWTLNVIIIKLPLQRATPTNNQLGSSDLLPRQMDGVMVSDTRSVRAPEWKNSEREPGTTCSRANHA